MSRQKTHAWLCTHKVSKCSATLLSQVAPTLPCLRVHQCFQTPGSPPSRQRDGDICSAGGRSLTSSPNKLAGRIISSYYQVGYQLVIQTSTSLVRRKRSSPAHEDISSGNLVFLFPWTPLYSTAPAQRLLPQRTQLFLQPDKPFTLSPARAVPNG